MPFVTVEMLEGRTVEQKRKLAKDITTVVTNDLGLESEELVIVKFFDMPKENIAKGGKLMLDAPPKP